jgi:predicted nucleotidyltransferase
MHEDSQTDSMTRAVPLENLLAPDGPVARILRAAFPNAIAIYAFGSRIFGSRIQGTPRPDSDLDLALLVAGYAEPIKLWELAGELSDLTRCPVDLLDFRAASTVMQYQILMHGRTIWANQPDAGLFEGFVLNEKHKLDEARAGLLADIGQRGSIYGR